MALTESFALPFARTANSGRLWAWSALSVRSPGFGRAVFFITPKHAATSAMVIME